ncbi:MAG: hypothetical protein QOJ07_3072 [Thermoleophilaceae bacterium]|nr:hypothetical protein [Thermoleophilaceae bacterium]
MVTVPTGYFTDDSMLRRVHRERAVALSGPRALLMQAAHPLAVTGLLSHSSALDEPYERLARTAAVMDTIGFGSKADADRITKRVRSQHRRVKGAIPDAVGPYPARTPYAASDPDLLLWVLFTLVDSGIVVYSRYVRSMPDDEQAAYWDDYKVVGRLFGLKRADMPDSLADLRAYKHDMLTSGRLIVTDWARTRARQIVLEPPVPIAFQPLLQTVNFITVALLPDEIRRQYGFGVLPLQRALVAGGAEYVKRAVIPLLPDRLRLVPAARAA